MTHWNAKPQNIKIKVRLGGKKFEPFTGKKHILKEVITKLFWFTLPYRTVSVFRLMYRTDFYSERDHYRTVFLVLRLEAWGVPNN